MSYTSDAQRVKDFEKAYDTHADEIFRYIYFRLSDREKAKELTQEVFLRTWKYMNSGKTIEHMRAFLFRTARNIFINEIRSKRPVSSLDLLMESGFEVGDPQVEKERKMKIEADELVRKLDGLNEAYREVISLRYGNQLSIKEIAEVLGESENVVSVRIHRAVARLREMYEKNKTQ